MPGALEGIRVLDLTRLLPGAVATQWLADSGAEVIKIEQPSIGDYARDSYAALFEQTNRGKKSVEIDLKGGKESFLKLAGERRCCDRRIPSRGDGSAGIGVCMF